MAVHNYTNSPGKPLPSYFPVISCVRGKIEDGAIPITALCLAILAGMAFVYWDQRHQPNFYKNAAYFVSGLTLAGGGYWVMQKVVFPKEPHDPFLHQDVFAALDAANIRNDKELNPCLASMMRRPGGLESLRTLCAAPGTAMILYIDQNGLRKGVTKGLLKLDGTALLTLERKACIYALRAFGDRYLKQLKQRFENASDKAKNKLSLTKEEKLSLAEILWLKDCLPLDQAQFEDDDWGDMPFATRQAIEYLHGELRRYHRCEDWSPGDLALFHQHRSRQVRQAKNRWIFPVTGFADLFALVLPESWVGHDYHTQIFCRDNQQNPQIGHFTGQWQVDTFGLSQRLRCRHIAVKPPEDPSNDFSAKVNNLCANSYPNVRMSPFTAISCAVPRWGRIFKNKTDDQTLKFHPEKQGNSTTSLSGSCTTLPYYIHNTARQQANRESAPLLQAHTRPSGLYGGRYAKELEHTGWVDRERVDVLEAIIDWEPSLVERVHNVIDLPFRWLGIRP